MSRITIGNYQEQCEDSLEPAESIQFLDVAGNPRVKVTAEGWLEISFDSGIGKVCVTPVAGNVLNVYLRS